MTLGKASFKGVCKSYGKGIKWEIFDEIYISHRFRSYGNENYVFPTLIDVIPLPWAGEDDWALLEGAGEVGRATAHTRLDKKGRLG